MGRSAAVSGIAVLACACALLWRRVPATFLRPCSWRPTGAHGTLWSRRMHPPRARPSTGEAPRRLASTLPRQALALERAWGEIAGVLHHLQHSPMQTSLQELSNTRIEGIGGAEILAFTAPAPGPPDVRAPVLLLIHEFFGLNPSIIEKAKALSKALRCTVIAPDVFRGTSTSFIPQAIWLALTTPQPRVNSDLDAVLRWARAQPGVDGDRVAVMGFCFGGGKAIRYTTQRQPSAATVVCYGSPLTEASELRGLKAPVCGVFGEQDFQFPMSVIAAFREALGNAKVEHDVQVYDGVGHAFWEDMGQIERQEEPQTAAWNQIIRFLRDFFARPA